MRVYIRTDASATIGTGHVMRCLTLARQLIKRGISVQFICTDAPGNLIDYLREKGLQVHGLESRYAGFLHQEQDARQTEEILLRDGKEIAWLIVDHYGLDVQWEQKLRPHVKKMMVIDDLANRAHDCDLLLDQNLYHDMDERYAGLIPDSCQKMLGPRYVLLREEFTAMCKTRNERDGIVRRILIFFGGSDPTNETVKALGALQHMAWPDAWVDVVVGKSNVRRDEIAQVCARMPNVTFHCQIDNMAELIARADLGIGAGGATTWERCILGLPAITVIVAENQREMTQVVAEYGAILNIGWHGDVQVGDLAAAIQKAIANPQMLRSMGHKAIELMGSSRLCVEDPVVEAMLEVSDG